MKLQQPAGEFHPLGVLQSKGLLRHLTLYEHLLAAVSTVKFFPNSNYRRFLGVGVGFFSPPPNTNYLYSTNSIIEKESCSFPVIETTFFLHQCQVSEGREPLRHSRQMVSFQVPEKSQIWQLHKHINKNSHHSICTMNEDNTKSVTNEIISDSLLWNSNSFYFIN